MYSSLISKAARKLKKKASQILCFLQEEFVVRNMWNSSFEEPHDNLNETFDELQYLAQMLGPQRQPLNKLVPLTIVYTVMSITGIFGNLSVCCVILRIPSMRSATNYYLFSLAVSDLLILLLGKKMKKTQMSRTALSAQSS